MGNQQAKVEEEQVSESDESEVDWDELVLDDEPKKPVVVLTETTVRTKKEAVGPKVNAAAVAALRAKAKAKPAAKVKSQPVAAKTEDLPDAPVLLEEQLLPPGDEGVVWEVLEDCIVRQERDIKSARRGVVQAGERCTQTGPWRADPNGRVRMPIKGPRGVFGWITIDERCCMLATGEFGSTYVKLTDVMESSQEPSTVAKSGLANDIDDLLDMFGDEQPAKKTAASAAPAPKPPKKLAAKPAAPAKKTAASAAPVPKVQQDEDEEEEDDEDDAEATRIAELTSKYCGNQTTKRPVPPPSKQEKAAVAEATEAKAELSEAAKTLRTCRKKIRELTDLEAKAASTDLSSGQQEKLSKLPELRVQEKSLAKTVLSEQREAKGLAPKKSRPKKKGGVKAGVVNKGAGSSLVSMAVYVAVAAVAGAAAWIYLTQ